MQNRRRKIAMVKSGFTLIEVIVVVAIVGILAAVAWPAYQAQSMKNRRSEAIDDLGRIQVFMRRCYADNGGYECCDNSTMDAFKAANPPPIPPARNYTLTFTPANVNAALPACKTAQGYTVTAVPTGGGSQTGDSCASFQIDHLGNRTATKPSCWGD